MGAHDVQTEADEESRRTFTRALLDDVAALERMLDEDRFGPGDRTIGAEQELFLVDRALRPAPLATEMLERLEDPRFTTELARFNLEANLTPRPFRGDCLRALEAELEALLETARSAAKSLDADVLLTGILPTLQRSDLGIENLTPLARYREMNRVLTEMRGGEFRILIRGLDELQFSHDNVLLEACNTSFQVHYQVAPAEFARLYNLAQVITAPLLAAAVNSPVLLGQRLWEETRVALFQRAVDERSDTQQLRGQPPRVGFGDDWVDQSILEIYRENIARYRVVLTTEPGEAPAVVLDRGEAPPLRALCLHNGTVWRWNRACYGVGDGIPHLRIENRVLPSGPTVLDEVANAAFFTGLMYALDGEYGDVRRSMAFADTKNNFFAAARYGLNAQFTWLEGRATGAPTLILEHLLPLARAGLRDAGVEAGDIERYLGTIEERVKSGQTGAQWMLRSLQSMGEAGTPDTRMRALTSAMLNRQQRGDPAHRWPLAALDEHVDWRESYRTVGQVMTTDLFTVRQEDLVDLAAKVMTWKHIRYVPLEDGEGRLIGLLSHRELLQLAGDRTAEAPVAVASIMIRDPLRVGPETPTSEAIGLMRRSGVGCLPVVQDERLVGIVTAQDFLALAERLLEDGAPR